MAYMTLDESNKFSFKCPIFGAKTKMASCIKLRTMFWMGKRPEQRKGCQACMEAGKCPAAVIAQRMAMSGHRMPLPDEYASTTEVTGKLRKDVLERIRAVMVMPSTLMRHAVPEKERRAIETSNTRIVEMLGTAPAGGITSGATMRGKGAPTRRKLKSPSTPSKAAPKEISKVEQAAASGDLSAALE